MKAPAYKVRRRAVPVDISKASDAMLSFLEAKLGIERSRVLSLALKDFLRKQPPPKA